MKANNNTFITNVCDTSVCRLLCKDLIKNSLNPLLLSMNLKSRFQANKFHKAYILLSVGLDGKYVVNNYCCSCRHGCRTVGCCSHVMSLLWYTLYIDPNNIRNLFPSSKFDNIFDRWNNEYSDYSSDSTSSGLDSETDSSFHVSSEMDSN